MIRENTKPWFFISNALEINQIQLPKNITQHIKAKRLPNGSQIMLFNQNAKVAQAKLESVNLATIISYVSQQKSNDIRVAIPYCEPRIISACLIQAVELGASTVYLTHTDYSYSNASHKRIQQKHIDKWQLQMIQACQQSENPYIPKLILEQDLPELLNKNTNFIVMGFCEQRLQLDTKKPSILFIGPEGGFSPKEQNLFIKNQAQCLKIGDNILKVTTAVTAGLTAILMQEK